MLVIGDYCSVHYIYIIIGNACLVFHVNDTFTIDGAESWNKKEFIFETATRCLVCSVL